MEFGTQSVPDKHRHAVRSRTGQQCTLANLIPTTQADINTFHCLNTFCTRALDGSHYWRYFVSGKKKLRRAQGWMRSMTRRVHQLLCSTHAAHVRRSGVIIWVLLVLHTHTKHFECFKICRRALAPVLHNSFGAIPLGKTMAAG